MYHANGMTPCAASDWCRTMVADVPEVSALLEQRLTCTARRAGRELANSFSELTDAVDQRERLSKQVGCYGPPGLLPR